MNYEEIKSIKQKLTFQAAKDFFTGKNVPFEANRQKSLHIQTSDGIYTNLGLLLSDQAVHTVKLAVFEGKEKAIFKDRREFTGSIFRQLKEISEFLNMYNHNYNNRDYPEEALREALLNAFVHRDYAYSSSIMINIYDDRMEFISIGGLINGISVEDIEQGISVLRNEHLANVFYRLELIEAYGTGIPKIMQSYANFPGKPKINVTTNVFKIILPNRNVKYQETTYADAVSEKKYLYNPYTANENAVLALFEKQNVINRKDVEKALSVSQAMAVRYLRTLVEKKALQVIGSGKNTRYVREG